MIDRLQAISIHALVKRATYRFSGLSPIKAISIHALVKRATWEEMMLKITNMDFNPRPRKEGDSFANARQPTPISISIHALVKRATMSVY